MVVVNVVCYIVALFLEPFSLIFRHFSSYFRRLVFVILRQGRIPTHIAFIMDGNRRYATKRRLAKRSDGHLHGSRKFEEILKWSLELGVKEVTVYAFSIENFKRPKEEVDTLMRLATEKLEELVQNRIRVVGELDLLPHEVLKSACSAMYYTRHYTNHIVNICFPYTSTAEILSASNRLLQSGFAPTESRLSQLMWVGVPDIVVRTSGERRLSDFLTWQCSQKPSPMIAFVDAFWPDFGLRHLLPMLLRYQIQVKRHQRQETEEESQEWTAFLQKQDQEYWDKIRAAAWKDPLSPPASPWIAK
ncbi:Ditrans,polycis-polyprenyl diphosphate synthase ((2E,6E)-farnesyl diphosphate specific) [Paramicrosporidium saccamoebae]|uniref:Alkyl transferase n=1 Tax=Paramicrosporidium saccamoebae TaxID=1246581 RepID=A0A2H9TH68_9FUNG|nr:Ditrans,polycis-polyprenyl diphosphate synthase ((2E,6E)-farnesyl diphosphate specific) [Paramicrosporidium saccamoebae]